MNFEYSRFRQFAKGMWTTTKRVFENKLVCIGQNHKPEALIYRCGAMVATESPKLKDRVQFSAHLPIFDKLCEPLTHW